jgi:hypothetical protein
MADVIVAAVYALASYCQYIREIPMLHRYEVRQRIVGWENKWVR